MQFFFYVIVKSLKSFFFSQRRGTKEQMEQNQIDGSTMLTNDNVEDDIVVDALEVERDIKPYDRDFIPPGGQIIGLDQAVLQSIERCRKFLQFFIEWPLCCLCYVKKKKIYFRELQNRNFEKMLFH